MCCIIGGTFLFVCVTFCCAGLGIHLDDFRPGIGDVEKAQKKIQIGMTHEEVRSKLGRPYRIGSDGGDEWDYWESVSVGSVLRVYFGADGRVKSSEWWVQ